MHCCVSWLGILLMYVVGQLISVRAGTGHACLLVASNEMVDLECCMIGVKVSANGFTWFRQMNDGGPLGCTLRHYQSKILSSFGYEHELDAFSENTNRTAIFVRFNWPCRCKSLG